MMDREAGNRTLVSALLIAIFGTSLLIQPDEELPLRRVETAGALAESERNDAVAARMWQDPLVVIRHLQDNEECTPGIAPGAASSRTGEKRVSKPVRLLIVMLRGESWPDQREERLRDRFAVNAALSREGFVAETPGLLRWFTLDLDDRASEQGDEKKSGESERRTTPPARPLTVPFEWFERPARDRQDDEKADLVLVAWVDETKIQGRPWHHITAIRKEIESSCPSIERVDVVGPHLSDTLGALMGELVVTMPTASGGGESGGVPSESLVGTKGKKSKTDEEKKAHETTTRSPGDRDHKDGPTAKKKRCGIQIFAATATVPIEDLVPAEVLERLRIATKDIPLDSHVAACGDGRCFCFRGPEDDRRVVIYRTTSQDDALADALLHELDLRKCSPASEEDDVMVLLSEQDSAYGRAWRKLFAERIDPGWQDGDDLPKNLVYRTWLRGLDGVLAPPEDKDARSVSQRARPRGAGRNQLDYVKRMADELESEEERLREKGMHIRSIGVLSVDMYDKLLLLRVLRSRFPRAEFFVADLDARLFERDRLGFTRNVIVGSHFGLSLGGQMASNTAPFRGAYQTATYLAARLALKDEVDTEVIKKLEPRVYEIGRQGPYDLGIGRSAEGIIVPDTPLGHERWSWRRASLILISTIPVFGLLMLLSRRIRRGVIEVVGGLRREWWVRVFVGVFVAALLVIWIDTTRADGEPFTFVAGISVWPTFLIQLISTAIGLALLFRAFRITRRIDRQILRTLRHGLHAQVRKRVEAAAASDSELSLIRDKDWSIPRQLWWYATYPLHWGYASFRMNLASHRFAETARTLDTPEKTEALLMEYFELSRPRNRCRRVVGLSVVNVGVGLALSGVSHFPGLPTRGDVSFFCMFLSIFLIIAIANALVFFVFDSSKLMQRTISHLETAVWSEDAARRWCPEYGPGTIPDHALVTTRVTRHLATATERFVFYPFVILLLMIVARSSIFDHWNWPWPFLLMLGTGVLLAVISGLLLRRSARRMRRAQLGAVRLALLSCHRSTRSGRSRSAEVVRLEEAEKDISEMTTGPFGSWFSHPALQAVLIPFGGVGTLNLLQALL